MKRIKEEQSGHIVVETVLGFTLFVFFVISILTLVNIVALQNRIHYALTQTAQELSMYSYALEVTGVADGLKKNQATAGAFKTDVNNFKDKLTNVVDGIAGLDPAGVVGNGQEALSQIMAWVDDPEGVKDSLTAVGLSQLQDATAAYLVQGMFGGYLETGDMDADTYLHAYNVVDGMDGLDFTGSKLIDAKGDIIIVVNYSVEYSFGTLPLPFNELHITQQVKTRAWLDGNGQGYESPAGASA